MNSIIEKIAADSKLGRAKDALKKVKINPRVKSDVINTAIGATALYGAKKISDKAKANKEWKKNKGK